MARRGNNDCPECNSRAVFCGMVSCKPRYRCTRCGHEFTKPSKPLYRPRQGDAEYDRIDTEYMRHRDRLNGLLS